MIYPSIEIQNIIIPNELNKIGYVGLKVNKKKYLFEINPRSDVEPNIVYAINNHSLIHIGIVKDKWYKKSFGDNWNVFLESKLIQELLIKEFGELKKLYFSDLPEVLLIIEEQEYSIIFLPFNK